MTTHLNIPRPPIKIHMQILNIAILAKQLLKILLARLLMDVGDEDDPAFDGAHGHGAGGGRLLVRGWGFGGSTRAVAGRRRGAVDVHFGGGHG